MGTFIDWFPYAKYLGDIIDHKVTFYWKNTQSLLQKLRGARVPLYPVLNSKSVIPMNNRLTIYKIYIKPIIMNASAAWEPFLSDSNWEKKGYSKMLPSM